jgi:hypothetical protein
MRESQPQEKKGQVHGENEHICREEHSKYGFDNTMNKSLQTPVALTNDVTKIFG